MTQEEIIEMARQAGFEGCAELTWENVICTEELVAFAKLVAEKERETCARLCDVLAVHPEYASEVTKLAAQAIRNWGQL